MFYLFNLPILGTYYWPDGRVYTGNWIHNKMEGRGEFRWQNGSKYIGQYYENRREGFGTYIWLEFFLLI